MKFRHLLILFRHIWTVRVCTSMLLVGTFLWLIAPQAFAASTSSDTGGWVRYFIDRQPDVQSVPEGGMQSTSDLSKLLIQPVLVASSAPTLSSPRGTMLATHGQNHSIAARFFVVAQLRWKGVAGESVFPVILTSLRPQGP